MVSNVDSTRISDDFGIEFMVIEFPDNQRLKTNILESLPILQKTALLFSMGPESKELIRLKVQELEQRIWKLAILSAVAGTGLFKVCKPGLQLFISRFFIFRSGPGFQIWTNQNR